jgi:hypothetical protein
MCGNQSNILRDDKLGFERRKCILGVLLAPWHVILRLDGLACIFAFTSS